MAIPFQCDVSSQFIVKIRRSRVIDPPEAGMSILQPYRQVDIRRHEAPERKASELHSPAVSQVSSSRG